MIKIAIVGLGNCASSLIQGLYYYRDRSPAEVSGLMHWEIGGARPQDINRLLKYPRSLPEAATIALSLLTSDRTTPHAWLRYLH